MRYYLLLLLSGALLHGQVSLTALGTPSTQNFNSLVSTGTGSTVPTGWAYLETGANANSLYTAGTGSSNTGDTYSFGAANNTDRAFGGLQSGNLIPTIGASFTNNTGSTITSLAISYVGEQWRLGATGRTDRLDFQYSLNATAVNSGTWTDVDALDFNAPNSVGTVGALDGNAAANRTAITNTITGLNIAPGATFWIRWSSFDAAGADDGLGIDDFSITPSGTVSSTPSLTINDISLNEGNSGTTAYNFTVLLSSPAGPSGVTFDIATADSTATSPSDYTARSLTTQTISAGNLSYSFTVFVNGDTTPEADENFFVNVTNVTGATVADGQGQGTIVNDDVAPPTLTAISAVQGTGVTSPLLGQTVTVQGVVTAVISNGYFLQTPDASIDGDGNTSEGIFVFTNTAPSVSAGQIVNSTGAVAEFRPSADPNSRSITQIVQTSVATVSIGNPLPAAVTLPPLTANGGLDQFERFEGMRVQVASLTVVAPTSGTVSEGNATATTNGVFYAVFPNVAMPFREAGIEVVDFPANASTACAAGSGCALPQFDANPERLRIDTDAITGQTGTNVNTGATLSNVVGVMHYGFRAYTIFTTTPPTAVDSLLSGTAASVPPAGVVTVAAMNVERLFDTVDDPGISDVAVTSTALAGRLNKMSLAIRTRLQTPDVIALEEVENLGVLQSLATKINNDAVAASVVNPQYQAYLIEGNDIGGIDVGFLVKSTVSVSSVTQLGSALTYTNPCDGTQDLLNDRPTLRLRGTSNGLAFTVFVNHLRSLNGVADTTPCTLSTSGGRVRAKRAAQANYVAGLVQDELTANASARILVVGDFNAFEVNDGYTDTINTIMSTPAPATQVLAATLDPTYPNMTNMLSLLPTAERYSYVFDGNHQTLDHAILSPATMAQFAGGGYVRLNADFNEFVYRGNFNSPERYSDHDPVYVRLSTGTNITSQLGISKTVIAFNRGTRLYSTTVMLTNNTANTISGPLQMVLTNITPQAGITNAASTTPAGVIYTALPSSLAPGATASVPVTFTLPASMPVDFTVNVFAIPSGA